MCSNWAPLFVNFALFTTDRITTNKTQSNCFIPLSYSLIYNGCVKSCSAKLVRNHSLIRYSLHCDWLLPKTDLKGHSRLRWLCRPINVPKSLQAVLLALDIMFTLIIWHVSRTNQSLRHWTLWNTSCSLNSLWKSWRKEPWFASMFPFLLQLLDRTEHFIFAFSRWVIYFRNTLLTIIY